MATLQYILKAVLVTVSDIQVRHFVRKNKKKMVAEKNGSKAVIICSNICIVIQYQHLMQSIQLKKGFTPWFTGEEKEVNGYNDTRKRASVGI